MSPQICVVTELRNSELLSTVFNFGNVESIPQDCYSSWYLLDFRCHTSKFEKKSENEGQLRK